MGNSLPDDPTVLVKLFRESLDRRDRRTQNAILRRFLELAPPLGPRWKTMAAVSRENGELDDAWRAMQCYAKDVGDSPAIRYELAAVSAQMGFVERAADLMREVPPDIPTPASNAYIRGTLLTNLGNFVEARAALREAVRLDPRSGQAWLALAMVGKVEPADSSAIINALGSMAGTPDLERAAHAYALGKVCHERGQYTKAFEFFDRGASSLRRHRPYDFSADRRAAEESIAGWGGAAIDFAKAPAVDPPRSSSRAIFVTGLPRSGTTLVEQILVSHSRVGHGDELGVFRILEQEVGGRSRQALMRWRKAGKSYAELAALYYHLVDQRFPGGLRFVDKSLGASRYLGLLLASIPDAPVIWVRRDPRDCAWSAYRTWFLRGLDWSWSLENIARHFRLEDALFDFWTREYPERILVVRYEQLVREPEAQIARINTFCGLQLEPAQLQPHRTERAVTTASVAQVREPINVSALGASDPYRRWLGAFDKAYGL